MPVRTSTDPPSLVDGRWPNGGVTLTAASAPPPISPSDCEANDLDPYSYEAAVMAGDDMAAEWLHGPLVLDDDHASTAVLEEDTGEGGAEDEAAWLPALTTDDRLLVREYMRTGNYPRSAIESIDEWPMGELRHLLANARIWKVAWAQRAADRIDSDRQLKELDQRRADSHATLERIYRDQATSLMARDADKSLILLTAREARRSASGNHVDGNPGLELSDISAWLPLSATLSPGRRTGTAEASVS